MIQDRRLSNIIVNLLDKIGKDILKNYYYKYYFIYFIIISIISIIRIDLSFHY